MPSLLTYLRFLPQVTKKTAVALTGGDIADLFTITGGPILLYQLYVEITTEVSNNACLIHFESDPTVGAGNTDICEGTGAPDIALAAIGDVFHLNGDSQDVMVKAAIGSNLPMVSNNNGGIRVPVGGIDMRLSTSDPTAGAATVRLFWFPLDETSKVIPSSS